MKNSDDFNIFKDAPQFTPQEKLEWLGDGEWVNELDYFSFKYRDYECQVVRIIKREPFSKEEHYFGGHLCGYVCIPTSHPYHHKRYETIGIDCHGGLTYGGVSDGYWIGFDCGHSGDVVPSVIKLRKEFKIDELLPVPISFRKYSIFNPIYRNMAYCINECQSIVEQLIVAEGVAK